MQKHILFLTLIATFFALHAADDKIITLQSNDGTCIIIPASVAQHSTTLHNLIGDCPETTPVIMNFTEQELKTLVDILNTVHQATSDEKAITLLRICIIQSEHPFTALQDFFDIYPLRQALAQHFSYTYKLDITCLVKKTAALNQVYKHLLAQSTNEHINEKNRQNAELIHRVIENIQLTDKENFLTSKGKDVGLFFTGVSVGEAAQHGLINMNYRPADTLALGETDGVEDDNISSERLERVFHFDVHVIGDYITSLEGFAPTAPIDITNRIRAILIHKTNIWHLPADSFKHGQDPERLLMLRNKIASMDTNTFNGLNSLTELNLSSNNITSIPSQLFKPLVNLKELSLSDNRLQHIHANMFKYCAKLKTIYLLDTLIPQQEIKDLHIALPNIQIYTSFSPLVASNYSLINS